MGFFAKLRSKFEVDPNYHNKNKNNMTDTVSNEEEAGIQDVGNKNSMMHTISNQEAGEIEHSGGALNTEDVNAGKAKNNMMDSLSHLQKVELASKGGIDDDDFNQNNMMHTISNKEAKVIATSNAADEDLDAQVDDLSRCGSERLV